MRGLFRSSSSSSSKTRRPPDMIRVLRDLLTYADRNAETRQSKRAEKMSELKKLSFEMRELLYGEGQAEPSKPFCVQLTQEFFKDDTLRVLITCLPKLDLGVCQDFTHIIAKFQIEQVNSRLIASDYLEQNLDLMDILLSGYEDSDIALIYGTILRNCIRHQVTARYVLNPENVKKFMNYIQCPNFEVASDAASTFKDLLTRHRSTVADFLSSNYDWFFQDYNTKLLESQNYITRRHAAGLLGVLLADRLNASTMMRYVSSLDNMRLFMNLLRETNKAIQFEAFNVFKLFVCNPHKPPEIINVIASNREKLLRFLGDFQFEKGPGSKMPEDVQRFEADKTQVLKEIAILEPSTPPSAPSRKYEISC